MLVTVAELKTYMEYKADDTTNDALFTDYIENSQNLIETFLNYTVEQSSRTYNFIGDGSYLYCLSFIPVASITSIQRRASPLDSWETVSSSKYTLIELNNLYQIYYDDTFNSSYQYKVIVSEGYSVVPYGIRNCCLELCTNMWLSRKDGRNGLNAKAQTFGGTSGTTSYNDVWNNLIHGKLNQYRRITF